MSRHTSLFMRLAQRVAVTCGAAILLGMGQVALAAAPQVVTVPWRGTLDLPHETYNGKQIHLKGVASGLTAGATATWDPGDGSALKPATVNVDATGYDADLGVTHTYPDSSAGTPFTATLTVCNGSDCASDTYRVVVRDRTLDVEINVAIDQGLWYLHRQQIRNPANSDDGRFPYTTSYSRDGMTTASAVQAFQINNHFQTNPSAQDPYADTVRRGLRYMFSRLVSTAITAQPQGNPDSNGNGLGVAPGNTITPLPTAVGADGPYQLGQFMDAVVASRTPDEPVPAGTPLAALTGPSGGPYTYFDAVQDMVDMYAYGQTDPVYPSYRGGWRYDWNYPNSDNSANQWAAIGILPARDIWGATVPQFVIDENLLWLSASQTPAPPANATGYGYTGRGEGAATSPSGLVQAIMDGVQKTDVARWKGVEERMASVWNSWYRDSNDEYRLYALTKSMRLALPSPIVIMGTGANAIDWFKADCANPDACSTTTDKWGVARTLIRDQDANGLFTGGNWVSGVYRSAWSVIMLTGTLQLEPVAVAHANPNPGANGVPVNFDGTASYHQDPAKSIVTYEWDFDNDNITDSTDPLTTHAFSCAALPCTYPVRLTVTDNTTPTPLVDTEIINVAITNPPHPPTADANGPYLACTGEAFVLNGSGSYDIDEPLGDSITAYGWELDFVQPLDFDDETGVMPTVSSASAGLTDIGLRVTDDSAEIFGGPNLTNDDFTTAKIFACNCVSNLVARPKRDKIQLTWTSVAGASGYDIYRSSMGATSGYGQIAVNHVSSYATYLDSGLTTGMTYWYRVVPKNAAGDELCGSIAASARLTTR